MDAEQSQVPENQDDILNSPDFEAGLAYYRLDDLLTKWIAFNPGVTGEDVDAALARFREAIEKRDHPEASDEQ